MRFNSSNRSAEKKVYKLRQIVRYGMVMQRLGNSLYQFMEHFRHKSSFQTTMQLGIKLVDCLEQIHNLGFVYNDLKLGNIIIGKHPVYEIDDRDDASEEDLSKVYLIDFGLIQSF